MNKNITLAVDEKVLEDVRLVAAEEKTTVNALVRDFLEEKAAQATINKMRKEAAAKLLELSRNSSAELESDWKFNREDIYAERLSRHERHTIRGGGSEK